MQNFRLDILFLLFIFSLSGFLATAQETTPRTAPVLYNVFGSKVEFSSDLPPLQQRAGAPEAFYTHYWEFGDGTYSFEEKPEHIYKEEGEYTVRRWSTNNYDTGKPPTSRPENVQIDQPENQNDPSTSTAESPALPEGEHLSIQSIRDPSPGEDFVLITSYKNPSDQITSGKLYLFYNEEEFKNDNFHLEELRSYHEEEQIEDPQNTIVTTEANLQRVLKESDGHYRDYQVVEFSDLEPGEERTIFRTLKTPLEMVKDTSALITLRSVFVPDNNPDQHAVKDTELDIVTSHDPNKMGSSGTYMSFRFAKNKKINYRIKFQNNGDGPAETIRLETDLPDLFDKSSLSITDMYPKARVCPKGEEVNYSCLDTLIQEDKLIFTFKNIYLPGSRQKNVHSRDSTKGFVKYSLRLGEKLRKVKTRSRTAIYFDKNEPIYTNWSQTRFRPGISIGAKAGYIYTPSRDKSQELFAGVTLSPYKSYRGYLQAELFFSAGSFSDLKEFATQDVNNLGIETQMEYVQKMKEKNITAYLVPASYRYNLTDFLALGAGVQLQLDFQNKVTEETTGEAFVKLRDQSDFIRDEINDTYQESVCTYHFTNFNSGVFADLSLGSVRIGPSAGFRYVWNIRKPSPQLQAYVIWKF